MKKSHKHTELSDKVCRDCGKRLKKRLVETKSPKHITRCYPHGRVYRLKHQHDKDKTQIRVPPSRRKEKK